MPTLRCSFTPRGQNIKILKIDFYDVITSVLYKQAQKSVIGFWPTTDRVMIIKLKAKPFDINLIQVYTPASSSSDEKLEEFYNNFDD